MRVERNPTSGTCRFGSNGGFAIRIQEWEYLDGGHTQEAVSYLVMERGSHVLADGTMIEAGRLQTDATGVFVSRNFDRPFTNWVTPVVLTAVTSFKGSDAVVTRVRNVSPSGFQVGMQEQEAKAQSHVVEDVDYIAWEPSSGTLDGWRFEVDRTGNEVSNAPYTLVYPIAFNVPPMFLAKMQTANGMDTADLRWQNRDKGAVDVWVDEEQSLDSETGHTTEGHRLHSLRAIGVGVYRLDQRGTGPRESGLGSALLASLADSIHVCRHRPGSVQPFSWSHHRYLELDRLPCSRAGSVFVFRNSTLTVAQ